ncbi:F-box/LRR-repeat protein 13 [Alligator mississippiensis]|uniref:F-box/LRR-repeat protein 13 n=1 Tax=Alligator mississippiensis TaxID=8496 RepID=A0A151NPG0_ALLMI|nr:F-box/LRR-repeat protein 13 [Alligator mississippiensis]
MLPARASDIPALSPIGSQAVPEEDPLKFLEEKIREIMEKGLDGILWDMCIDPSLKLELKRISETYLHIIFGLNDKQLMTEELCGKAWNFHTRNLKNMCFQAWMQYCLLKKEARRDAEQNMALAAVHYNSRIIKVIVQKWSGWVRFHKEQMALAVRKIQWVFNVKLLRIILKAWHAEAQSSAKTKAYFEQLEKEDQEESFDLHHCFSLELIKEKTATSRIVNYEKSNLPERTLLQIFHYTDLIDLARCAQVSRTWMSVTQNSSLWSDIDFSAVKHKIQDKTVVNILQKWRTYVLRLNLRGCSSLHWPSFKSIGLWQTWKAKVNHMWAWMQCLHYVLKSVTAHRLRNTALEQIDIEEDHAQQQENEVELQNWLSYESRLKQLG